MAKINKETAERLLGAVPQDKVFYCCNSRQIHSMPELEITLQEIDEQAFNHHANKDKNDFSIWVHDVIGDGKLSRDLLKSPSRDAARKAVAARVASLMTRL